MLWLYLRQWLHSLNSKHKKIKQGIQYHNILHFENNFCHHITHVVTFKLKTYEKKWLLQNTAVLVFLNLHSTAFFEAHKALALVVAVFISIISAVRCVSMKDGFTVCAPAATITALQIYRWKSGQGLFFWPWTQLHALMTRWMAKKAGTHQARSHEVSDSVWSARWTVCCNAPAVVSKWVTDSQDIRALTICETFHNSPQKLSFWFA